MTLRELDVAEDGAIYAAASGAQAVLRVDQRGKVEVVLRAETPWTPTGIAIRGRDVYVLEFFMKEGAVKREEWLPRVRKLSPDGKAAVVAEIREAPK